MFRSILPPSGPRSRDRGRPRSSDLRAAPAQPLQSDRVGNGVRYVVDPQPQRRDPRSHGTSKSRMERVVPDPAS